MFGSRCSIANRGEIACRVIAHRPAAWASRTIAVYSDADAGCAAMWLCADDGRIRSDPAPARDSYFVRRAHSSPRPGNRALQAVHPGYGFLSARTRSSPKPVAAAGLVWVGPPPAAIRAMGSQIRGKIADGKVARRCRSCRAITATTQDDGVAGPRGGRGHRVSGADQGVRGRGRERHADRGGARGGVRRRAGAGARREARASSFGDDRVLVERYLHPAAPYRNPDFCGYAMATLSSACSSATVRSNAGIKRSIEEAPAPGMDPGPPQRPWARPPATPLPARSVISAPERWSSSPNTMRILLHGDEHAAAGRASRDRNGHRHST